jgi:hypothetical protein
MRSRKKVLYNRLWRNAGWALGIIAVALAIGMLGYSYFGNMDFTKSFANAAMILSGMGPLEQNMPTKSGEIFEGLYALGSGLLFFAVAGFALAPALHHILRSFHLEDEQQQEKADSRSKT